MVNKAKENFWRRMATRRGFRLEKSRQRDPNGTSFGKYKLHPVLTSRWHTADEIQRALYFSEGITAHTREVTMNWQEYTAKTNETAVYPGTDARPRANNKAITYLGLGIAGETGEVVDVIKKQIRKEGSWEDPEFRESVVEEIGDVFWYSAQLMDRLGITFDEVVAYNIDKLAGRKAKGTLKERTPNNGGLDAGLLTMVSESVLNAFLRAEAYGNSALTEWEAIMQDSGEAVRTKWVGLPRVFFREFIDKFKEADIDPEQLVPMLDALGINGPRQVAVISRLTNEE